MFMRNTYSPQETEQLAGTVAKIISAGTVICLTGDLGAGKTLFVQSLARILGITGEVTSPTFNLMNVYDDGKMPVVHFDLYRLETEEQLDEIGFYEYSYLPDGVVLIEWAEKFPQNLPDDYIQIMIERGREETERQITFSAIGDTEELLKELEKAC